MDGTRLMSRRLGRWMRGCAGFTALALTVALVPALPASAAPAPDGRYLALGDSVPFGYTPPQVTPPANYLKAANFVGYPEDVGKALDLAVANAACPGETTGSFIVATAQSNGCENSPGLPFGYRTFFPLHVKYAGAQLGYAVSYLKAHPRTQMVTIGIGANDVFVCQETTADKCTGSDFTAVLKQIRQKMRTILAELRDVAHYQGPLVLVSYYSLNYADPIQVAGTKALNAALEAPTKQFGGTVADGFGLFQRASAAFGGDPCKAGLLVPLPDGTCNVHPSVSGHLVLAAAVEQAIAR